MHAYARLKKPYLRQAYMLLSMLGVHVALFWILSHLPKSGIYLCGFDICTVDKSVYMQAFAA